MGNRRVLYLAAVVSATVLALIPPPAVAAEAEPSASNLEGRAREVEAELAQRPRDEMLLAELARVRVNAAHALAGEGPVEASTEKKIRRQLLSAAGAWSRYLEVARKPSPGLAEVVAPALFQLAELSKGSHEAFRYVKIAARAQRIVTARRPSEDSWTILAYYELFAQRYDAADQDVEKALARTGTKSERESLEKSFEEVEKNARRFGRTLRGR